MSASLVTVLNGKNVLTFDDLEIVHQNFKYFANISLFLSFCLQSLLTLHYPEDPLQTFNNTYVPNSGTRHKGAK